MRNLLNTIFVLAFLLMAANARATDNPCKSAYLQKRYDEALTACGQLARQGDDAAQSVRGAMYGNGEGVKQDYAKAFKWIQLSAAQGNRSAQFYLGSAYIKGFDTQKNAKEAVHWFRLVALQGDASAQYDLGLMYEKGLVMRIDIKKVVN